VGLTVDGKDTIRDAFAPYVHTTGDLYGVDEIVAELQSRPELVRRHFRLWLSGTAVLQTVLNQEKYVRSSWLRKRIPRTADTFVPHEGFDRAKAILDEQHVCVIAGIPGVGKTTMALMLAAWLMGNGYEVHEISQDAEEITALWREDTPQLFLYDDFLGQTTLAVAPALGSACIITVQFRPLAGDAAGTATSATLSVMRWPCEKRDV